MKTPDQALFDHYWKRAVEIVGNVYDATPMQEVDYPFITIGYTDATGLATKSGARTDTVSLNMHAWGKSRAEVSGIIRDLKATKTDDVYGYRMTYSNTETEQIILDRTVTPHVWHGYLSITFSI